VASDSRALTLKLLADTADFQKKLQEGSKDVDSFGEKAAAFGKKVAAALAVATAAIGAFAVAAVKAAAEDEAAQLKLAETIKATTTATDAQIKSVEAYITQTSIAIGVTDDQLRPAFSRLVRSTKDVEEAQNLLNLALDLASATGKPLEVVTNALGKAYDGNTTALSKLGLGIDNADLKSQTFDETFNQLTKTFGNFAEKESETTAKQLERVKIALDEAKESIGAALLPIVQQLTKYILEQFIPALQAFIAGLTGDASLSESLTKSQKKAEEWGKKVRGVIDTVIRLKDQLILLTAVLIGVFAVNKIAAAVTATILLINGLIRAYNALKASSIVAGIAQAFALNPLLGVGAVALAAGVLAGATALARKNDTAEAKIPNLGTYNPNEGMARAPVTSGKTGGGGGGGGLGGGGGGGGVSTNTSKMMKDIKTPSGKVSKSILPNERLGAEGDYLDARTGVVINVNAPSVIDEEGFTRAVVSALNNTGRRTGAGVEQLAI